MFSSETQRAALYWHNMGGELQKRGSTYQAETCFHNAYEFGLLESGLAYAKSVFYRNSTTDESYYATQVLNDTLSRALNEPITRANDQFVSKVCAEYMLAVRMGRVPLEALRSDTRMEVYNGAKKRTMEIDGGQRLASTLCKAMYTRVTTSTEVQILQDMAGELGIVITGPNQYQRIERETNRLPSYNDACAPPPAYSVENNSTTSRSHGRRSICVSF